jgi:ABC-type xylose transport system substrate-binding protein
MFKFLKNNWVPVVAFLLLLIMSLPLLYFSNLLEILSSQQEDVYSVDEFDKLAVGVCLNNLTEARWMKEWALMEREASRQGLTIRLKVAHHSVARQAQQIANLVAHQVKVLIINPVSRTGLESVLEEAHRQGVKIIAYDELTAGPADLFLGVDYQEMGRIQAKALLEKTGPGNYLVLKGPPDSYRAEMLYNGQHAVFKTKSSRIMNIVAVNTLTKWSADEAVNKVRAAMTHQNLHAVLAPNDLIAEELVNFFKEQKLTLPYISGAGAEITACQRILHNEQLFTVYYDLPLLAKTAVNSAKDFIRNKKPDAPLTVTVGGRRVPAYIFPVYQITTGNLQSILVDKLKLYTNEDLNRE